MSQKSDICNFTEDNLLLSSSCGKMLIDILHRKIIDIAKTKDTCCEFKNSDVPPTTCSHIEQQHKSYCVITENDTDSVQKFRISKTDDINANPEKDMSTQIPKKKTFHNGKKVIALGHSLLRQNKPDTLSKSGFKVNVKLHPIAKAEDITDHFKPATREKRDAVIIHVDTNDLTNDVSTMKYVRSNMQEGGGDI